MKEYQNRYKKTVSLEVYVDDKKHGVKDLVLTCPNVFVQNLNDMCLDSKMVHF